jgi:hypothetical protein
MFALMQHSIEEQSTVGFFHGVLCSHLQNGLISALQESGLSGEQARSDAASFASLGILADPNIQSNAASQEFAGSMWS